MKKILIVDPVCPIPYTKDTFNSGGLGGTESTALKLALALSEEYTVHIHQHGISETFSEGKLLHVTSEYVMEQTHYDFILVLRSPITAARLKDKFINAKVWVWLHDLAQPGLNQYIQFLVDRNIGLITVSDFHKTNILEYMKHDSSLRVFPKMRVIHNMVADELGPDETEVDVNKLVFFSSPHKGLKDTLEAFRQVHNIDPSMKLYVSNPGYYESINTNQEGVVNLGSLGHEEVLKHVRSALCVFYPNYIYPETFGLVFAEANAVGTPVITHPIGAAREVLETPQQLMDCRETRELVDRVLKWKTDRPKVSLNPKFRLSHVLKDWKGLIR